MFLFYLMHGRLVSSANFAVDKWNRTLYSFTVREGRKNAYHKSKAMQTIAHRTTDAFDDNLLTLMTEYTFEVTRTVGNAFLFFK